MLFAPISVNPALIRPKDIFSILSNITLPVTRRFPLNISDSHFSTFISLCKLTTTIKFSTVIFIITIPILDIRDYDLYETYILPIEHGTYPTFLTNVNKYFLIDKSLSQYHTFPNKESCKHMWNKESLCSFHHFLISSNNCEYQIFMKQNATSCEYVTLPATYDVWEHLSDNQWLFASSKITTAELQFLDKESLTINLPRCGLLTIPYQAKLITEKHIFEGHNNYNITINHVIGNFSGFQPISLETTNTTFKMINFDISTLNDLEKRWTIEKNAIKAIKDKETQSWFMKLINYLGLTTSIILGLILLYLIIKIYRCLNPVVANSGVKISLNTTTPEYNNSSSGNLISKRLSRELNLASKNLDSIDEINENSVEPESVELTPKKKRVSFKRNASGRFSLKSPFMHF